MQKVYLIMSGKDLKFIKVEQMDIEEFEEKHAGEIIIVGDSLQAVIVRYFKEMKEQHPDSDIS